MSAAHDTIERLRSEPVDGIKIPESAEWKAMYGAREKMGTMFLADLAGVNLDITSHVVQKIYSDFVRTINDIYKIPDGIF